MSSIDLATGEPSTTPGTATASTGTSSLDRMIDWLDTHAADRGLVTMMARILISPDTYGVDAAPYVAAIVRHGDPKAAHLLAGLWGLWHKRNNGHLGGDPAPLGIVLARIAGSRKDRRLTDQVMHRLVMCPLSSKAAGLTRAVRLAADAGYPVDWHQLRYAIQAASPDKWRTQTRRIAEDYYRTVPVPFG